MDGTIYFVDDETSITVYILELRDTGRFPGFSIRGAGTLRDIVERAATEQGPTIYVLDSNMPLDLEPGSKQQLTALLRKDVSMPEILYRIPHLSGLLVSPLLKKRNPRCRIILLTAFYRTIERDLAENRALARVINASVDELMPKNLTGPPSVEAAIQRQIQALRGSQESQV